MADSGDKNSDSRSAISPGRILLIVGMALLGAALFGLAGWVISVRQGISQADAFSPVGVLWLAMLGGCSVGYVTWVYVIGRHSPKAHRLNSRDSVERIHRERAQAGAFSDIIIVVGVALGCVAVFQLSPSVLLVLSLILGIACFDFVIRYKVLEHRES